MYVLVYPCTELAEPLVSAAVAGSRAAFSVPLEMFDALSVVRFAPLTAPNKPDHVPLVYDHELCYEVEVGDPSV